MNAADLKHFAADLLVERFHATEHRARRLRAANLFTDSPPGSGHRTVDVSPREAINLMVLSPVADIVTDAPETVRFLRRMTTRDPKAVFGSLPFGAALDAMIAGQPGGAMYSDQAEVRQLPNEIEICAKPYFAKLTWLNADGLPAKVDVYFPPDNEEQERYSTLFVKTARIDSELLVAIARAVNTKEKTATGTSRDGSHVSSKRTAHKRPVASDNMHNIAIPMHVQLARNDGLTIPNQVIERTSDHNEHYRVE
jgi:MinD-like ATPase involved in chromosome partitioning or flagellar assembly